MKLPMTVKETIIDGLDLRDRIVDGKVEMKLWAGGTVWVSLDHPMLQDPDELKAAINPTKEKP